MIEAAQPRLVRRFGLLPATALNMTNMMGAGPFITTPLLMSALGGPEAMLGWLVALVIVICDGMAWSQLGAATLGYYDVCYIGDEVRDPGRVIPRSILISTAAVALIYLGINLAIIGVIPWREFVPASDHAESRFIVSVFMQRLYGERVAAIFTLLVLWTAFGSVFALLLGYPRIPFAAAQSGYFFRAFARLHPTKGFPSLSLLVLGAISILAGFFSLGTVIDALIVTRILVQFMGRIVGLMVLRRRAPAVPRRYRMWLYPLPALVALLGWIFIFATTDLQVILFGLGVLALGCLAFLIWSRRTDHFHLLPLSLPSQ